MAAITKVFATVVILLRTALYGGTDVVVAADQDYDYTGDVDHETAGRYGSHMTVEFAPLNTVDDLIVDVFASLDGSAYDTIPFEHHLLRNTGKPQQFSMIIKDVAHFRVGLKSSGTNTTFEYRVTYQAWTEVST